MIKYPVIGNSQRSDKFSFKDISVDHILVDLFGVKSTPFLFFISFPFCRGEDGHLSLRCTNHKNVALYIYT